MLLFRVKVKAVAVFQLKMLFAVFEIHFPTQYHQEFFSLVRERLFTRHARRYRQDEWIHCSARALVRQRFVYNRRIGSITLDEQTVIGSDTDQFGIAVDGLFFSAFARLHPRTRVPLLAILVQGLWGATLVLLGTFQQLFTAVIFTSWISYAAVVAAVVVLRHKQRDRPRPYRVPGYPWLPALFVLAALGIVASALVSQPLHAGLAFLLILSGLPVYALLQRSRKREPTSPTR